MDPQAAVPGRPHARGGDRARSSCSSPGCTRCGRPSSMRDEEPHTSVVVPSLTLDQSELRKLPGASFYEERLLFLLIRLRNPRARMVFVTSQPVHPFVLEYYFQFLAGIPASHARARLTLLCAYDALAALAHREDPGAAAPASQRIRDGIHDTKRAYLTVFNSTPLERRLAVLLGIPLNGVDPNLIHLGTKSGQPQGLPRGRRGPARWARRTCAREHDVENALLDLRAQRPGAAARGGQAQRQLLRRGQRDLPLPGGRRRATRSTTSCARSSSRCPRRRRSSTSRSSRAWAASSRSSSRRRRRPRPARSSASARAGEVLPISTHDQILGGPSGQVFLGCIFPADETTACASRRTRSRSARCWPATAWSAASAWTSWCWRASRGEEWKLSALEINLRMGGTTHPYLALQFLTGGQLDPATGLFRSPSGQTKYYRATDNLHSELLPRPAPGGPDRDPDHQQAPLQPRHRVAACSST